tara:strand:+ start:1144 stop:1365 length:222 start_codon:yes stop_codon:yes gene_type:complete
MNAKTIEYSMKQLQHIENDNDGVKFHQIKQNNGHLQIYVEFGCGKNITLSDDEVYYQATEYLKSEIDYINQNK